MLAVVDPHFATASVCLAVAHGSRSDPPGGGGLAHLLEHLLMSAPVWQGRSFCEQVERLGGQANAETGLELMRFYAQVHSDDIDQAVDLLCRSVFQPDFDQAMLDGERDVVCQELQGAQADPSDAIQDAVLASLFPAHPLGRPVGGSIADIDSLTLSAMSSHHAYDFLARPAVLVVVAPRLPEFPLDDLVGKLPALKSDDGCVPLGPPRESRIRWPAGYCWVCFGARSPGRDRPGRHAFVLLAALLGSSPSSLLYRLLRNERSLSYSFQAWDREYTESGAWRLLVGADQGSMEEIIGLVRATLDELAASGPEAGDLAAAQRQAEMAVILDTETSLDLARLIAGRTNAGRDSWSIEKELAALRAVSSDEVRRAAAQVRDSLVVVARPEGGNV